MSSNVPRKPVTVEESSVASMRQREIDNGSESDAKKKKHGHRNISPTVSFSSGDEGDGRTEEKQNRMSDAVPSAINRALAVQETATGMLYHPSRLSYQVYYMHSYIRCPPLIRCSCTVFLWRCGMHRMCFFVRASPYVYFQEENSLN